jgi:hypothetical protein
MLAMFDINGQLEDKWSGELISTVHATFILTSNLGRDELTTFWNGWISKGTRNSIRIWNWYLGNTQQSNSDERIDITNSEFLSDLVVTENQILSSPTVLMNGQNRINFLSDSMILGRISVKVPFLPATQNDAMTAIRIHQHKFGTRWNEKLGMILYWDNSIMQHYVTNYMKFPESGFRTMTTSMEMEMKRIFTPYRQLKGRKFMLYIINETNEMAVFEFHGEIQNCHTIIDVNFHSSSNGIPNPKEYFPSPPSPHSPSITSPLIPTYMTALLDYLTSFISVLPTPITSSKAKDMDSYPNKEYSSFLSPSLVLQISALMFALIVSKVYLWPILASSLYFFAFLVFFILLLVFFLSFYFPQLAEILEFIRQNPGIFLIFLLILFIILCWYVFRSLVTSAQAIMKSVFIAILIAISLNWSLSILDSLSILITNFNSNSNEN